MTEPPYPTATSTVPPTALLTTSRPPTRSVSFTCEGTAQPQGSKVRNRYKGVRDTNATLAPWREYVADKAREAMGQQNPWISPVEAKYLLFFQRPKSHYGTGRNAGKLKESAPLWVTTKPDWEKCARGISDAISGIIVRDDSQIVSGRVLKMYAETARVIVEVRELAG